jgi:hypothetical protein
MGALRCPVCKAENVQGPTCRRCKADLSLLFQLEEARQHLLDGARREARAGCWQRFLSCVSQAHALRADEQTRRLRAVVRLLRRDYPGALSDCNNLASGGR